MLKLTKESKTHGYVCEVLDSVCEHENSVANAVNQRMYVDFHYDVLYRFNIANTFNYYLFALIGFITVLIRNLCPRLTVPLKSIHLCVYVLAEKTKPASNRLFDKVDIVNFGKYVPKIPKSS